MESSRRVRAILSFVHTADAGSFAAAGRTLGVSAAAIGKNVASLESALGIRLFNRTTRILQLTEEGKSFLDDARRGLELLDGAVDKITTRKHGPSGRVRLSTIATFGREQVLPLVPKLLARYPALQLEMDFDDRMVDLVRDGYDIAIRGGTIPDSALISRPVFKLNMVMVASPTYLNRMGEPQTPEQLRGHQLIARSFLNGRAAMWNFKIPNGDLFTFDPSDSAVLTLSAPDAVIQSACDGVGVANIGLHLAWPHLKSGALKLVLHDYHYPGDYEMVLQYPHRALVAPRVKAVVEFLLEELSRDASLQISTAMLENHLQG